jgi:predicted metal-dependent hydrolase
MVNKLRYGDTIIPYSVIQTKRKKTIQIFVEKDDVEVHAPQSMNLSEIKKILNTKISWIFNKQLLLKERKPEINLDGNSFLYLGKPIHYVIKNNKNLEKISYEKNQFIIYTKYTSLKKIQQLYYLWLEEKYSTFIQNKFDLYSKKLQVKPKGYKIKNLESKWGSASDSGNITLNIHLLKAPRKMIDYVILHELIHLRIKGHGHDFWTFLSKFMPDYEKRKRWLETNQTEIMR